MIRDRLETDLDPLCAVVRALDPAGALVADPRTWLQVEGAVVTWVFDQAPVSVVPTGNVIGHVAVRVTRDEPWLGAAADRAGVPVERLLVVSRLVVRPHEHDRGVARFLLREAARVARQRDAFLVLDPDDAALRPPLPPLL
ncbi:hypothetical protein GCM10027047_38600 [Rhodococcus aerolatus]